VNLPELTKAEQTLLWGQGQVNLDHPKATVILTIAEALKSSGYDWATVLNIFKVIQEGESLPTHFSIVNNKFLVFSSGPGQTIYSLESCEYVKDPGEGKLMALTFWI
tara:strand:- start:1359 stop:1679 length:321 start_codon:yes stop_codon:yes gene_type:complete